MSINWKLAIKKFNKIKEKKKKEKQRGLANYAAQMFARKYEIVIVIFVEFVKLDTDDCAGAKCYQQRVCIIFT